MKRTEILIIGSGVAGLSTAYHLETGTGKEAPVVVLEKEDQLGPHASSKNSGMIHHFHPIRSMREQIEGGVQSLRSLQERSERSFLTERDSLFLFPAGTARELEGDPEPWGGRERRDADAVTASLKPDVVPSDAAWYVFERDGLIDSDRLLRVLHDEIMKKGIPVRLNSEVQSARREGGSWRVETSRETVVADRVVNAAGAWAEPVGALFGAESKNLVPYARHLYVAAENLLPPEIGFYWDAVHDIYFRHHDGGTLLSVCDNHRMPPGEPPEVPHPPELLRRALRTHYPQFEDVTVEEHWFCHRTRAPDRVPCISADPDSDQFYWVGGLEGHGITASMWVGEEAARVMDGS